MAKWENRVLYTTADGQEKLKNVVNRYLPKEHGMAYIPRAEIWIRGKRILEERVLFPGYVFLHTDYGIDEIHEFIKSYVWKAAIKIRELGYLRREEDLELSDVTKEESGFLDYLWSYDGILRMSKGYKERDNSYVIMEGPLAGMEGHIKKADIHNRKAFLDIEVKGYMVKVGLEVKPKRYYFPDDPDAPEILTDGSEADLKEIAKKMMQG